MTASSSARFLTTRANILLPGLYAWVATVVVPAFARESSGVARLTAVLALAVLVTGPFLASIHPRVGRGVGVFGFAGLALITWALCPLAVAIDRIDPIEACLGGVGWMLFAFGWGAVRDVGTIPEDDPHVVSGTPLRARDTLPTGALLVFVASLLGAGAPLAMAWRVARPQHALLAHAVAVLCAVAMVTVGIEVAVARTERRVERAPGQRMRTAARPLTVLVILVAAGVIWWLLR
jgi:hypothetical protein